MTLLNASVVGYHSGNLKPGQIGSVALIFNPQLGGRVYKAVLSEIPILLCCSRSTKGIAVATKLI